MTPKRTGFLLLLALSFLAGMLLALGFVADYDFLAKYQRKEVRLSRDLTVSNTSGHSLSFPKGTVLYYERSYEHVDFLLVKLVIENVNDISSPAGNNKEESVYWKK